MILGRVVGQVWATRKHAKLTRVKLLLVRPHGWYRPAHDVGHLVAIDQLGAGPGDDVVVCLGKSARDSLGDDQAPVEAAIMAIVDRVAFARAAFTGARPLRLLGDPPGKMELT